MEEIVRKAKIVCTLGPASSTPEIVEAMIRAGMDVARVNFSHGDAAGHAALVKVVRSAAATVGRPVAVLGDLCGPKIRVNQVAGGEAMLVPGSLVELVAGEFEGNASRLPHTYEALPSDVRPGDPVLINDGLLGLRVQKVVGDSVHCVVEVGGIVSSRKGMNLPATEISAPALTDKDRVDIALAQELDLDYLALSFVRTAEDVRETQALAQGIPVLAKIEKPEALTDLDEILAVADGIMVARGDLGVELGHERVPLAQKRIIKATLPHARPVITATQMLESMIVNETPTRAEVSDVANAVLDGTDAVMLSAETSVGRHPVKAVETMARIIEEVERDSECESLAGNTSVIEGSYSAVVAEAMCAAAREHDLAALAIYTESGRSAALVAAERPAAPVIAFTRHESIRRRLALVWGIYPLHGDWVSGVPGVVAQAERELLVHGLAQPGDDIAISFGMRLGDEPFQTNMLKLWRVRQDPGAPLEITTGEPY
jgi:pyruvate kinase